MGYLEEMNLQLENENFPAFLRLWEEYKTNQDISAEELHEILRDVYNSEFKEMFGRYAEETLPLLEKLEDTPDKVAILRLVLDLQNTNSEPLALAALNYLSQFEKEPGYKEKLRLIGLRTHDEFQGAIRNFELLNHMAKGKFIYHTGGWGVGEIMDISLIREQLSIEFENVLDVRELSFDNAFKTLIPLDQDHFLSKRYGNPDQFENEARENPLKILKLLLKDLGPKNAQEIKEELYELVIPSKDWAKWWQSARAKAKKDTKIQTPKSLQEPFVLLKKEVSHVSLFKKLLQEDLEAEAFLDRSYEFMKQYQDALKDDEVKKLFRERLLELLNELQQDQELLRLQVFLFLEEFFNEQLDQALVRLVQESDDIDFLMNSIAITSMKKKLLSLIRKHREDWESFFSSLFLTIPYHFLREYILKELTKVKTKDQLKSLVQNLLDHPVMHPECFVWYFQKVQKSSDLVFGDKEGRNLFFEALFILFYHLENDSKYTDLCKKIHSLIISQNFKLFRDNIVGTSIEYVREILLLITKCTAFNHHDFQIFVSLAKVVHPSLEEVSEDLDAEHVIWTSSEGYQKLQERIRHIATVETIDNAKEIETARAYGDLRENAEYKFAQERRARLQAEMKLLSTQLSQARIISPEDISTEKIGIGTIVELINTEGKNIEYTILGPWDADPDKSILSFQSQLARAMIGHKKNDTFNFKDTNYTVKEIKSYTARV